MTPQFCTIAVMSVALFGTFASADVSSLGYNRVGRLTTRLQRQELGAAPYAAAGYRPRQPFEFPTPDKQQFFPNGGVGERPHSLAQPQPRPRDQTQFQPETQYEPQPQSQPEPEPLPETQAQPQPEVSGFDLEATPNLGANGDYIDAPNTLYDAPSRFRAAQVGRQRFAFSRQQISAAAAPQPRQQQNFRQNFKATAPQRIYGAPAENMEVYPRQRQQFAAVQQARFAQAPQRAYVAPAVEVEPQAERLTSAVKSERITAEQPQQQREEREEEAEVATDIEVTEVKKTTPVAPAAPTPATNVFYYPASAVGFVHPLTAAYYQPTTFYAGAAAPAPTPAVATAATAASAKSPAPATEADAKPAQVSALVSQTAAPAIASLAAPQYYAAPPYLQQYTFAAPAQLQAW